MALLEILQFPDPRLRVKAKTVDQIDEKIRQFVADMYETMYSVNGIGLAATQVGVHQRVFVMDVSETRDVRYCVINPEIVERDGVQMEQEGCLSVGAGVYDRVERPTRVIFRGMDIEGKHFEQEATGLMAACVSHEIDHLNGMLFIDHLSRLKQDRIRKKITKSIRRE
jgi:peptide deformylase